jgi:hypothetical protein
LVNIYYDFLPLKLPASWGNSGRGGISIGAAENGRVQVRARSGARTLKAGETLPFVFELYLTPFRTIDTGQQWDVRFIHPNPSRDPATLKRVIETMDARSGPRLFQRPSPQKQIPKSRWQLVRPAFGQRMKGRVPPPGEPANAW